MRLGPQRHVAAPVELEELPEVDPVADEIPGHDRLSHDEAHRRMRDHAAVPDDRVEPAARKHLHGRRMGLVGADEVEDDVGSSTVRELTNGVGDIVLLAEHLVRAELRCELVGGARPCRSPTTLAAPSTRTSCSAMCPTPPTPITAAVDARLQPRDELLHRVVRRDARIGVRRDLDRIDAVGQAGAATARRRARSPRSRRRA